MSEPASEDRRRAIAERRELGRRGERRAARYLRRQGLRIVATNWRGPTGELDIIARDGDQLVIVEVRSARTRFAGGPEQTVGPDKQRRLARLAEQYLRQCPWRPRGVRFDVIAAVYLGFWRWDITWFRNAFEV